MSQVNSGNAFVDMAAQQWQALNTPLLNVNDVSRLNSIVLNAVLQAGVTLLQGCTDTLKSAAETVQQRAPQATKVERIVVE